MSVCLWGLSVHPPPRPPPQKKNISCKPLAPDVIGIPSWKDDGFGKSRKWAPQLRSSAWIFALFAPMLACVTFLGIVRKCFAITCASLRKYPCKLLCPFLPQACLQRMGLAAIWQQCCIFSFIEFTPWLQKTWGQVSLYYLDLVGWTIVLCTLQVDTKQFIKRHYCINHPLTFTSV